MVFWQGPVVWTSVDQWAENLFSRFPELKLWGWDNCELLRKLLADPDKAEKESAKKQKKEIPALPKNFTRFSQGDLLIRQETQRLLEKHAAAGPILTEEGRVCLRSTKTGAAYKGLLWKEILQRAPQYFDTKYSKIRAREEYGKVVHADFVRMSNSRGVTWLSFDDIFTVFHMV